MVITTPRGEFTPKDIRKEGSFVKLFVGCEEVSLDADAVAAIAAAKDSSIEQIAAWITTSGAFSGSAGTHFDVHEDKLWLMRGNTKFTWGAHPYSRPWSGTRAQFKSYFNMDAPRFLVTA